MMKRLILTVLVATAGLMAQPPAGPRGNRGDFGPRPAGPGGPGGPGVGRPVTGAPYSALEVTTEQQTLAGGNTIQRENRTTIHRDGQGRVRMETEMVRPDGANGQTRTKRITIHDPVGGFVHELDPQTKVANSMQTRLGNRQGGMRPGNPGNSPGPRGPNRQADPNVQTEDLGTQSINGVLATGTRMTRTIPAGAIGNAQPLQTIHERWVSTDLQVPVMVKTTDPRFGTRVTQLTNINRVEPDASLFQVPSDYTVRRGGFGGPGGPRPARPGQIN